MEVGQRFTKNGKTYVVTEVWGTNFGMREVTEDELPTFEAEKTFEEEVEAAIEEPKKKVTRRKKV